MPAILLNDSPAITSTMSSSSKPVRANGVLHAQPEIHPTPSSSKSALLDKFLQSYDELESYKYVQAFPSKAC